jgi:hypothetical protein
MLIRIVNLPLLLQIGRCLLPLVLKVPRETRETLGQKVTLVLLVRRVPKVIKVSREFLVKKVIRVIRESKV